MRCVAPIHTAQFVIECELPHAGMTASVQCRLHHSDYWVAVQYRCSNPDYFNGDYLNSLGV